MKCEASQELVVGGFTDPQGRRAGFGALLVGYFAGRDFVFAGKVGTGFDAAAAARAARGGWTRWRSPRRRSPRAPACRACGCTGCGPRSWCRSPSPSGRITASFAIRGCSACATTKRHATWCGSGRDITHPDKVLFPDDGITKGELAAYYDAVAPALLPHLRRRPITMERFPAGIAAKGFLQKNVVNGFPAWLKRVEVPKKGGTVHYPLAGDRRSLQWLANQNAITLHVWPSRAPRLDHPDLCVFDLDPADDDAEVLRTRRARVRDLLAHSAGRAR